MSSWTFGPNNVYTATWAPALATQGVPGIPQGTGNATNSQAAPALVITLTATGNAVASYTGDLIEQAIAQAASNALPRSGGTMTGALVPAVAALTFGSTPAVNAALGNVFTITLTSSAATIQNPSNPADGQVIRFRVTQGGSGSNTLAFASAYDFGTAGAPTLSTSVGKVDVLAFEYSAALTAWMYLGSGLGF